MYLPDKQRQQWKRAKKTSKQHAKSNQTNHKTQLASASSPSLDCSRGTMPKTCEPRAQGNIYTIPHMAHTVPCWLLWGRRRHNNQNTTGVTREPAGIYTNGSTKSSTIWTRYFTMAQVIPYGLRIGRQIWECVEAPESNFSLIHVLFSILLQATFDKLHRVFNFSRCLFIFGVMRRRSNPKFGGFKRLQAHFRNDVQRFEKKF